MRRLALVFTAVLLSAAVASAILGLLWTFLRARVKQMLRGRTRKLKLQKDPVESQQHEIEDLLPKTTHPLRILLAEDNAVNQLVARRLIEKMGHLLTVVSDGVQALQAVRAGQFDLILMDVQMPEMDGFEATARIREAETGHVAIVAMTAHAMSGDREHCLTAGIDDYISKPISIRTVSEVIDRVSRSLEENWATNGHE